MESDKSQIKSLLDRLTWWQRASGIDPEAASEVKSSGEAIAAIDKIKLELDGLGVSYYWDPGGREYRLETSREPAEEEE